MPESVRFCTDDKSKCPDSVGFKGQDKYPKMVMIRVSISNLSKPVFYRSRSSSVDSPTYIEKCLEKRLLQFTQEHHADSGYIFWPALVSAHYSGLTFKWMNESINFVPKHLNPTNVPQARLI